MVEVEDWLDFINGVARVASSTAKSQLEYAKADSALLAKAKIIEENRLIEAEKATVRENLTNLKETNKETAIDIESNLQSGLDYGVSLNEYVTFPEEYKTNEFDILMNDYGTTINKDLSVGTKIFASEKDAIAAHQDKLKATNHIQAQLTKMMEDLSKVEDFRRLLGKAQGDKAIYDLKDVQYLIKQIEEGKFEKGIVPEEDIISETFFKDKPWAEEYMKDPSFIWGKDVRAPGEVQAKELTTKSAIETLAKKDIYNAYGFTSWEDNATILTAGQDDIIRADNFASDYAQGGEYKKLKGAMGIPEGDKWYTFTAAQSKNPTVVKKYKVRESSRALKGLNHLTDGELFSLNSDGTAKIGNKRIGDLVIKYNNAKTAEQKDAISVALARVVYEEITPDGNTLPEHRDTEFGIDLNKIKALDVDVEFWLGFDGIPENNQQSWDEDDKALFGPVFSRLDQIYNNTIVGLGNNLDPSNFYYNASRTGVESIFPDDPLNQESLLNQSLDTLDIITATQPGMEATQNLTKKFLEDEENVIKEIGRRE